ncbi:MAG: hypothetical protein VB913_08480, partial [Rhodospirillales bacterium]
TLVTHDPKRTKVHLTIAVLATGEPRSGHIGWRLRSINKETKGNTSVVRARFDVGNQDLRGDVVNGAKSQKTGLMSLDFVWPVPVANRVGSAITGADCEPGTG